LLVVAICAGTAFGGLASGAEAKGGFFLPRETQAWFSIKASNGYRIQVVGKRVGNRHHAKVVVARGTTVATYRVPARIGDDRLRVNLGTLGRIDVRFHPRKREVEENQPGCHGQPPAFEKGSFKGRLRFRGENGYTRFSTARVRGYRWNAFREACELSAGLRAGSTQRRPPRSARPMPAAGGRPKDQDKSQLTELGAAWTGRSRSIAVSYSSLELPLKRGRKFSLSFATAQIRERRGRMDIERVAVVVPDDGALLLDPLVEEAHGATLTLQPPFAGSASYEAPPGETPTWSGSLRVHLPGAEVAPLTGKRFVAAFCRGSSGKAIDR